MSFFCAIYGRQGALSPEHKAKQKGHAIAIETVKWFNPTKRYGFIILEDGNRDIFVHITAILTAELQGLTEGQKVNYEVAEEPKGLKALDIAIAD